MKIYLKEDEQGFITDELGNAWTRFTVDYLALQEDGTCAECGAVLTHGWLLLDGGEEYCDEHVEVSK